MFRKGRRKQHWRPRKMTQMGKTLTVQQGTLSPKPGREASVGEKSADTMTVEKETAQGIAFAT